MRQRLYLTFIFMTIVTCLLGQETTTESKNKDLKIGLSVNNVHFTDSRQDKAIFGFGVEANKGFSKKVGFLLKLQYDSGFSDVDYMVQFNFGPKFNFWNKDKTAAVSLLALVGPAYGPGGSNTPIGAILAEGIMYQISLKNGGSIFFGASYNHVELDNGFLRFFGGYYF